MPTNHRRVPLGVVLPEASRSLSQDLAPPDGIIARISTTGPGRLLWWGTVYDGAGDGAKPVDVTGDPLSITGQLEAIVGLTGGAQQREVIAFEPVASPLGNGRPAIEIDLPTAIDGWIRLISLAGGTPGTHLWINYAFMREGE